MKNAIRLSVVMLLLNAVFESAAAGRGQPVSFQSGADRLAGLLVLPPRAAPHGVIVFLPGDGEFRKEALFNREDTHIVSRAYRSVGDWHRFLEMGFACFAWDKPGCGDSTGDWREDTIIDREAEVISALDFLKAREDIDLARIGLWGISQAGWIMPAVAAERSDVAFLIAVSCPGQTIVEESAYLIRRQLEGRGIDTARAARASDLYLRKWEMLRAGVPFAAQNRLLTEKLAELGNAKHEWLEPWTPKKYQSLATDAVAVDSHFYSPASHLGRLKIPLLAVFGGKDTQIDPETGFDTYRKAIEGSGNRRSQIWKFPEVGHVMSTGGIGTPAVPQYWASVGEFLAGYVPQPDPGKPKLVREVQVGGGQIEIRLNFFDEDSIGYEANLTSVARLAMDHFTKLFGGPPLDSEGQPRKLITFDIRHGNLSGESHPDRLELTIGSQKVFGYLDWRMLMIHEILHLWNAETFRYADYREQWFNEGATEYVTFRTAVKLGIQPPGKGPFILVRSWGNYNAARGIGEISLREAGHEDRKKGHYFLVYHGGLTACTVLDYEIRRLTDNARTFEDLLRYLYQNHNHTDRKYSARNLLEGLREISGHDFADFFRRHIHGTEIIPIGRYITRMEIEALRLGDDHKIPEPDRKILKGIFLR
jgi:pimeloyl-ACP methyl ester carboxylesterase